MGNFHVTFFCPLSQLDAAFMPLPTGWDPSPTISMLCPGPYIAVVVAETAEIEGSNGWSPLATRARGRARMHVRIHPWALH